MLYIHNRYIEIKTSIIINKVTIKLSNEIKYLEIIFDQEMRFKSYLQHVIKKSINVTITLINIIKYI